MLRESRGFTLVELIITIVILGILAAVGYPGYLRFVTHGQAEGSRSVIGALAAAERIARQNSAAFVAGTPAGWVSINTGDGMYTVGASSIDTGDAPLFEFQIDNVTANTFRITARGISGNLDNGDTIIYNYDTTANPRDSWDGTLVD
jgi:type IV pilus assembly protein PilE